MLTALRHEFSALCIAKAASLLSEGLRETVMHSLRAKPGKGFRYPP